MEELVDIMNSILCA